VSGSRPDGRVRWVAPPGWPATPQGWSPPTGWVPDPAWGPVPPGWSFWQDPHGRPAAPVWSPVSHPPDGRAYPPFWKAGHLRNASPRFKKSMAGAFAFILFVFFVGATADDKPTGLATTATAADSRETPSATPTAEATPTGTPAAEPAPASSPEPPPPPAAPSTTDQIIAQAQPSTALALLATLEVKGRAPKTGYDRAVFGQAWADTDRNGCGTRDDMLKRDLTGETFKAGTRDCVVLTGQLADPYTGRTLIFTKADAGAIQIDHVVALSDAWQKGAQQWDAGKRLAFANDPLNLLAVDGPTNASKSDGDAATWLPPNKGYRCAMVARQTAVKAKYALWVTAAERDAIARVLSVCPNEPAPTGGSPTTAAVPGQATGGAPQPAVSQAAPAPVAAVPKAPAAARRFANCTEMRTVYPHGVGMPEAVDRVSGTTKPVTTFERSSTLYEANQGSDGDKDNIACEA